MSSIFIPREDIHKLTKKLQKELSTFTPNIIICGKGPCSDYVEERLTCDDCPSETKIECFYDLRQRIRDTLKEDGCLAALFEENENIAYASMDEKLLLREEDVDLVFMIPVSEGSASELGSFASDKVIRPKLRVLVPYEFHPWYGSSKSYLTSVYNELMADYGHVYPFSLEGEGHPDPFLIVSTLVSVYKRFKLLELTENKDNNS